MDDAAAMSLQAWIKNATLGSEKVCMQAPACRLMPFELESAPFLLLSALEWQPTGRSVCMSA